MDLVLFLICIILKEVKIRVKNSMFYFYNLPRKLMDAKILILDTVTAVVYIQTVAAHLDEYSLIASIFLVA